MVGKALDFVRIGSWAALLVVLALFAGSPARADDDANCPGHPDALGVSRTLVVDPRAHPRIGSMQYPETLPLEDHEVVLTFDDGPVPKNSNQVLQILADQCIKATFFTIGEQAQASPEGVRKLLAAGHTIATHSQTHPLNFNKMTEAQAKAQIDAGIASVAAALPDPGAVAPFFRIPGLMRAEPVENYAASQGIQIWSTDVLADDWHRISSERVYELAIKRLEEAHKGILLLHDIQARTVGALPKILHELKVRGYRIVHVVPATAQQPATPTDPEQWLTHRPSLEVALTRWPTLPNFVYDETELLPAPALSEFETPDGPLLASSAEVRHGPAPWPRVASAGSIELVSVALAVPDRSLFEMPEKARAAIQPFPTTPHHFDMPAMTAEDVVPPAPTPHVARGGRGRARVAHVARGGRRTVAAKGEKSAPHQQAHAEKGAPKRPVRVASLKKHVR
jgi:peptidoglycan-N-acetylglucosamine deacetylase